MAEVGIHRYIDELGLSLAVEPAQAEPSVRRSLEELDELRKDGFVTEEEYSRKRSEILRRL
jgi:hypothetical protein